MLSQALNGLSPFGFVAPAGAGGERGGLKWCGVGVGGGGGVGLGWGGCFLPGSQLPLLRPQLLPPLLHLQRETRVRQLPLLPFPAHLPAFRSGLPPFQQLPPLLALLPLHFRQLPLLHLLGLEHRPLVKPQLVRKPDRQRHRVRAFDMDRFHVAPALRDELLHHAVHHRCHVLRHLFRSERAQPDLHARRSRRAEMDQRAAQRALDLLGALAGGGHAFGGSGVGFLLVHDDGEALARLVFLGLVAFERDGYGSFRAAGVERLAQEVGQQRDDALVGEEQIMLVAQLPLGFETLVFGFELADADDPCDALGELRGEGRMGDDVFEGALGVGDDEAEGGVRAGVEVVGEGDFAGFEAGVWGYVVLCGEDEPDELRIGGGGRGGREEGFLGG